MANHCWVFSKVFYIILFNFRNNRRYYYSSFTEEKTEAQKDPEFSWGHIVSGRNQIWSNLTPWRIVLIAIMAVTCESQQ